MQLNIRTKSEAHHKKVLEVLYALGYQYHGTETLKNALRDYPFNRYPTLVIETGRRGYVSGNLLGDTSRTAALGELLVAALLDVPDTVLPLTGEYTARITKDTVEVGCQKIPHEKVLELAKAIKEAQS